MIFIVDYGLGNLLSVAKAFQEVSGDKKVAVSRNAKELETATHIVLPGVGNFVTGMRYLNDLELVEPLTVQVVQKKKPFLGICLGMQLLAEVGEESGETSGLSWISGRARRLRTGGLKIPHIGWNDVEIMNPYPLFQGISRSREFYFVHSYCLDCPHEYVVARCTYGDTFTAAIQKDNIYATQFHPEKSRDAGLKLLKNFLSISC
ncbi:MAG: imidazole glycerol phosphate synthase, glutamine amidotransferase subunit [Flavobacteria bacterium RIFCSPLOWO2_12_FULL_35_11]|nr:MAG: imidazole glycerol phosphate synthase, glutamine amidotransferase subunit [Flavobacteria bacterium RIFCSPLOWO2_12_FULL_35_11]